MANKHAEFWLALMNCPNDVEQQSRYWNGYLAWKLPDEVRHAIRNVGETPFNQFTQNNRLALTDDEKRELDNLAEKNGGHPRYSQESAGSLASYMDFSDQEFVDGASFGQRVLLRASFKGATFEGKVDFRRATFTDPANFNGAIFKDRARFDDATFENTVYFKGAKFKETAVFNRAAFKVGAYFQGVSFLPKEGFRGEMFGGVGFQKTTFTGEASFENATFKVGASFDGATFHDSANFKGVAFANKADFQRTTFELNTDFVCVTFNDAVIFNDAAFKTVTSFNGTLFKQPPKFFGTRLHEDTNFSGVDWREAESSYARSWWEAIQACATRKGIGSSVLNADDAIRAWDRLALIMSNLEKLPERHEFYRLRMRAQRGKEGCSLLSLANWLFDVSSDYGWSVPRALAWWFGHFTVMALIIFAGAYTIPAKPGCGPVLWDSFLTSFANAHTLLGLASKDGYLRAARDCLVAGNHTGWILISVGVLEAIVGPILLFVVLLSLRNRFRLR